MPKKYISIQDAADFSKKSIQTIRRAIKAKKIKIKKQKTPQGFNYLINHESFCQFYGIKIESEIKETPQKEKNLTSPKKIKDGNGIYVTTEDFKNLTATLEKMITQHSDERQNFIRLVDTLQEKIFVLENQLNLLKTPSKKWYQFWQ